MSDTTCAISVDKLSRMYKRYRQPRHRVLDALGFKLSPNDYDEFWALRNVSFDVARGERVGLIGRNGAGKSTLLNIVCGRLMPTGGTVKVNGKIQALMELGTGFHPEFRE
jgi:lipopolysaccharide transport system ATP-binding protein